MNELRNTIEVQIEYTINMYAYRCGSRLLDNHHIAALLLCNWLRRSLLWSIALLRRRVALLRSRVALLRSRVALLGSRVALLGSLLRRRVGWRGRGIHIQCHESLGELAG